MHLLRLSPILPALLLLLIIGACRKERSLENASFEPEPPPAVIVQTSVEGRVLNEQLQPVQNAMVSGGGANTTTDLNGHFLLEDVELPDNAAVITVEKAGYFKGYRTLMVRQDQIQYIQVELLLKNQNDINAATGDIIAFPQGTLTFPANGVLSGDDQPYSGMVAVRSIYIDAEGSTVSDQMPGDLRGLDKNNRETGLRAFSMIVFNMEDGVGNDVFPDPTKPVAVRIAIPSGLAASAPRQISMWHFDSGTGFWKEESVANHEGIDYVGTASKAGYWLCATTVPQITLTATVVDQRSNGLSNTRVTLLTKKDFIPAYGFTNAEGVFHGKVPSNAQLIMTLTDNCSTVIRQQEIGPFNASTQIDSVSVTLPENISLVINGRAKDCSNFNVVSGNVIVNVDNQKYSANITLGRFSLNVLRCSNDPVNITFEATDSRTGQTSTMTMNATSGTISPTLEVCD